MTVKASTPKERRIATVINQYRMTHHLHRLTFNFQLAAHASAHSHAMLARHFFAHTKDETGGEVIAWGTGRFSSPAGLISLWRSSSPHRKVLLTPSLRYVGVGVAVGKYFGQPNATIVTVDFK